MAEYIEREALLNEARERAKAFSCALIYEAIKEAPACDVVEIVRCKDCFHSRKMDKYEENFYPKACVGCTKHSTSYHSLIMRGNDFCSYGERKENNV